jgi:hypothetical protein
MSIFDKMRRKKERALKKKYYAFFWEEFTPLKNKNNVFIANILIEMHKDDTTYFDAARYNYYRALANYVNYDKYLDLAGGDSSQDSHDGLIDICGVNALKVLLEKADKSFNPLMIDQAIDYFGE